MMRSCQNQDSPGAASGGDIAGEIPAVALEHDWPSSGKNVNTEDESQPVLSFGAHFTGAMAEVPPTKDGPKPAVKPVVVSEGLSSLLFASIVG